MVAPSMWATFRAAQRGALGAVPHDVGDEWPTMAAEEWFDLPFAPLALLFPGSCQLPRTDPMSVNPFWPSASSSAERLRLGVRRLLWERRTPCESQ